MNTNNNLIALINWKYYIILYNNIIINTIIKKKCFIVYLKCIIFFLFNISIDLLYHYY